MSNSYINNFEKKHNVTDTYKFFKVSDIATQYGFESSTAVAAEYSIRLM